MNTKRIVVISYHTCPLSDEADAEIGGMNIYVLELSKALAKKGVTLDIFTRAKDPESPRIVEVCQNLRVIHLQAGPVEPLSKKAIEPFISEFLDQFYVFIQKEKVIYTLVSCHYYLSGIVGVDIKKKLAIPMMITFHTLGLMKNLVARSDEERESLDRIKAELDLTRVADCVIATSETDASYLRYLYGAAESKIAILTPGVNLSLFKPANKMIAKKVVGANPKEKLLLFVGRIEPLKGIDVLLYALKILLTKNPYLHVGVWIIGGDLSQPKEQWPEELRKLAKLREILDISTSVTFIGRKEQEALPNYYNAADLVVMPSHYESFGITAIEAMACGVPVITTDVTGVSNLIDIKHEQLITSANNPLGLADKIISLLRDEEAYTKISKSLAHDVRDLSWKRVADHLIGLCRTYVAV